MVCPEREILPDQLQLGGAARAINIGYDESAILSKCRYAVALLGRSLHGVCHADSFP